MVELPQSMRALLVEHLDEYMARLDDGEDFDNIAEAFVEAIAKTANEVGGVDEDVLTQLEVDTEAGNLIEALSELLENGADPNTGEDAVQMVEKVCEIEWLAAEDDEDGFFSNKGGMDS